VPSSDSVGVGNKEADTGGQKDKIRVAASQLFSESQVQSLLSSLPSVVEQGSRECAIGGPGGVIIAKDK
jgi:hypothetical protein